MRLILRDAHLPSPSCSGGVGWSFPNSEDEIDAQIPAQLEARRVLLPGA